MDHSARGHDGLRARLAAALPVAMKARDQPAVAALRSTLSALANAEAVGVGASVSTTGSAEVAGSAPGVGAAEAVRRALADREVADIVLTEATEREEAARAYDAAHQPARATRLRAEAAVIRAFLV